MVPDRRISIAVNRLPGRDGWLKRKIFDLCRDAADFRLAVGEYAVLRSPRSRAPIPVPGELIRQAEEEIRLLDYFGIGFRMLGDADFPAALAVIEDPPFLLYHRGPIDTESRAPVAVVGTRRPSAPAQRQAFRLGLEFALAGYPVVSGMAFGIDRAAHEGALSAFGRTWAVLAGGLDRPGPRGHRKLAARILDRGGALIGEIPPGCFPAKYAFPRRNRILSGLCRGCVVVQAPARSGALITADFALDQNRDLYVASSGLEGAASDGTRNLETQGAPVVESAADVLGDWGRFLDIRTVRSVPAPEGGEDLVRMMRTELLGRMHRFMGGWFEYRGA